MIYYEKRKNELKVYLKDFVLSICKPFLIAFFVSLAMSIYILIFAYIYGAKREDLINGYSLLGIAMLMLYLILIFRIRYKKSLQRMFEDVDENGILNFALEKKDSQYIVCLLNTQETTVIKLTDIKKKTKSKKMIYIKTNLNNIFFFPRTMEMDEFFDFH